MALQNFQAGGALAAGIRGGAFVAVEGAGKGACSRGFANPSGTRKQEGMVNAA
jgi:hypothetical protein